MIKLYAEYELNEENIARLVENFSCDLSEETGIDLDKLTEASRDDLLGVFCDYIHEHYDED